MQKSGRVSAFCILPYAFSPQPASAESGALQSAHNMRILSHRLPNESAAVILDHGDDRPFIDPEVIDIEPRLLRVDAAMLQLLGRAQRRIECVEEAVSGVQIRAIPGAHSANCGHRELGSESDRRRRRCWCDRTVVANIACGGAAC